MFELTTMNIATLLIDGSTIFLLIGLITQSTIMRKRGRPDDRIFFTLVIQNMVIAVSDIVTYLADGKDFPGARFLNMSGVTVFYLAMIILCMTWTQYALVRFKKSTMRVTGRRTILFIPGVLMLLIVAVNFFAGYVFYEDASQGFKGLVFAVDKTNVYHYGILFVPMFVLMVLYMVAGFALISRYRRGDNKTLIPVWIYFMPLSVGLIVPFVFGGISLASIGIAMSILFTHLGSASEITENGMEGGERA
ncbi:MAG: hypothetical protein IKI75_00125 [Lachnospiraceae bacterium]|nr:hypothetical protein [Lachnospiraceae bacterium]